MRQSFDETADPSFGARHLPRIRAEMARLGLDGFVIPHEDEHQNEYLPEANERLAWATGFTGSAGAAVVMAEKAAVFVDGRYTIQVKDQIDPALFEVRDLVEGGVPLYLEGATRKGQVVGYDPRLHSPDALAHMQAAAARSGAELRPVDPNPVDLAWGGERPAQPQAAVSPHPLEVSGEDAAEKRARIGQSILSAGADAALLTAPTSIAWLFNVRGGDVIRTPLPLAQALVRCDGTARLFLDPAKASPELRAWLGNQVTLEPPEGLVPALSEFAGKRVAVDPAQSAVWYVQALEHAGAEIVRAPDPTLLPRAAKNAVEIAGARSAHLRDAAAFARFLHWMATEAQRTLPDEIEVATRLEAFREATGALKDLSFDTIAAAGPNAAPSTRTAPPTSPAPWPSASPRPSTATASRACCARTSPSPGRASPPASRA